MTGVGPIGRLGFWTATHFRTVALSWLVIALGLGLLAPRVEHALSGAGWEATGSESVEARDAVDANFGGMSSNALLVVVSSDSATIDDPAFKAALQDAQATLADDPHVSQVVPPREGVSISQDRRTAVIQAGAAGDSNEMVRAAGDLEGPLAAAGSEQVDVNVTGSSAMWADFNEANKSAMLKSELISWPVTMAILLIAFGSLVAAGLPLLLTILGLVSAAGMLYIGTHVLDISIWAMNFALMFALALGIDYALFLVYRFRGALSGGRLSAPEATAVTMDTAGKAVLFSGLTVLISLTAVILVPSPAFRTMSVGIMLSVVFVLAATLTLLPAVLAKLGPRVDRLSLPWAHSDEHRSRRFERWGERLWRRPLLFGLPALVALAALAFPVLNLHTAMPSITVVPEHDQSREGYVAVQEAFGPGAPGALQVVASAGTADEAAAVAQRDPGVAQVLPPQPGADGSSLIQVIPASDPSDPAVGQTIDRLRCALPAGALVGGGAAENYDLENALHATTPIAMAVVLGLGFLLLLVALQAPLVAALGVVASLLATGAAFGAGKLIFQDGNLEGLLGFSSQGFVDAWAPVFFFAMIFAISMDYSVFLLSSAKEQWDRTHDPREAMIGGLANSGRVIFAAAAVMVAVFFTFALSGPLPPKEMGVILGIAVLLDALLVRLLLVPVLLRLAGRWAWWTPRWMGRLLPDVRFGHAGAGRAPAA
jgi:putative drug exporter of the RND superfamily